MRISEEMNLFDKSTYRIILFDVYRDPNDINKNFDTK